MSEERAVDRFVREVLAGEKYATVTEYALVLEVVALRAEIAGLRASAAETTGATERTDG